MKKPVTTLMLGLMMVHGAAASAQTAISGSGSDANASSGSAATASPVVTTTTASGSESSSYSGSGAAATNAGNSQTIVNNSSVPSRQTVVTAPSVFTPALTTTLTETCMGSSSLGVSVLGFGAGGGSTWQDRECVRRLNARELAQTLGDREAAREVLCGNEDVFRVYNALGRPCRLKPNGDANPAWVPTSAPAVAPAAAVTVQDSFVLFFNTGSTDLNEGALKVLDDAVAAYNNHATDVKVVISGHADRVGSEASNDELSKRRAEAARAYLISKGIPDQVQQIVAFGETAPYVATLDGVPNALNRRVQITFGPGAGS